MKQTLLVANLMLTAALLATAQKTPESMLGAALHQEEVQGDLKGAIAAYQKVVATPGVGRKTAAEALVHMGQCYEKLGDAESRKAYERVLRDYADQKEAVAIARAKLGPAQVTAGTGMSNRRLWTLPLKGDLYGTVSRDGRYVPYVDWDRYGDLFVHDLMTATDRQITNTATDGKPGVVDEFAEESTFSRDGTQLVYSWFRGDHDRYELRVVDLKGNGIPQFRRLFDNEDVSWITPDDWSPDGKWLAVRVTRKDKTKQIGLVSVPDGSLRVLKSADWRGSSSLRFSPDGKYLGYDLPESNGSQSRDVFVMAVDGNREIPAVVHRGQDLMTGWAPDGKWLLFASDRFGSMGLWGLPFADGRPQGAPELIKADIGRLNSIGITDSGALYSWAIKPSAVSLGRIHIGAIDFAAGTFLSSPGELTQDYLESNSSPTWSPDGKSLAYISVRDWANRAITAATYVVVIRSAETRQEVRELRVNLSYFYLVAWSPDGRSFLTRGADFKGRMGIYQIDAQTGDASPLRLDQPGEKLERYPKWSRDGKSIFFVRRISGGKEVALVQWDLASGNEKELTRRASLGVPNSSPDGRYIATPSVDPSTNSRVLLLIPTAGGEPREVMKVPSGVDPAELMNSSKGYSLGGGQLWAPDSRSLLVWKSRPAAAKSDLEVWQDSEVWQVPIDGGEPRKLNIQLGPAAGGISQHPDMRQIAFSVAESETTQKQPMEIWVLENFLAAARAKK